MKNEVTLSGTIFPSNLVDLDPRKYSWFEKAIFKLGPKLIPKVKSIKGCFNPGYATPILYAGDIVLKTA
jgi:hypothetical protein